jgi:hypothetical protein
LSTETRSRPRTRRGLYLALGLAGLTAAITWRATSLDGLPDIGEPFDVEAFCRPIPDESNAFVLYREAFEKLGKEPQSSDFVWELADEAQKKWLAENREALAIWRRGTERPDALYIPPRTLNFATLLPVVQGQRSFARLAVLEGTRLEAEGNFEGALDCYLAVLRASRHTGRRGVAIGRLVGIAMHAIVSKRLTSLAERPEVGASTIRRALEAAVAVDAMTPASSDLIKCEYLSFVNSIEMPFFDDPAKILNPVPSMWKGPIGRAYFRMARVFKKEPERSRRVYRLIVANQLAYCDLPSARRPPKVSRAPTLPTKGPTWDLLRDLYEVDETAPAPARALPAEDLARWYTSTIYAEICLPNLGGIDKALARERGVQASLLIALANQLYLKEHGKAAETVEELVGPYLKTLPAGYVPRSDR